MNSSHYGTVSRTCGPETKLIDAPIQSIIYNGTKHFTDGTNRSRSISPIDYHDQTPRKYTKLELAIWETYNVLNPIVIYENSPHLWQDEFSDVDLIKPRRLKYQIVRKRAFESALLFETRAAMNTIVSGNRSIRQLKEQPQLNQNWS